jgi:hypothetical protein
MIFAKAFFAGRPKALGESEVMAVADYEVTQSEAMLSVKVHDVSPDWNMKFLIVSDAHWDNPLCDRTLLKRHLDQALKCDALIIFPGDFFCAMQGRYDPRRARADIRPEHDKADYLDSLVYTAADFLAPYAGNILFMSPGNHEHSIFQNCETDLIARLTRELGVRKAGHEGFLRLQTSIGGSSRRSHYAFWHHGEGVGGDVTRGTLRAARWNEWVADAQVLIGGHIHQSWVLWTTVARPLQSGKVELEDRAHICSSTYKQEFAIGKGKWHTRKGRGPKPLGGTWLDFFYERSARGRVAFNAYKAV